MSVTATGTFTTSSFNGTGYTITGITGTRNGAAITGLLPPNSFSENDNLLSPSSPFVDFFGVSFTVAGAGDDGLGDVNVFSVSDSSYSENSPNVGIGTFTISSVTNSVPEPGSLGLAAGGLFVLLYLRRCWPANRSF